MFRERKFRFNVWVLGAAVTVAILLISKLLTLTGRWHSDIWSDAFFAVLTLAAVWLATGLMWAFVPTYVGPAGLRAPEKGSPAHDLDELAVAGAIGFVGLVAPHLVRRLVGSDPARVMLPGSLTGAALLLAADIGVRLVPGPVEIKLGVVTALIGVPFFLAMIFAERRALEGSPS